MNNKPKIVSKRAIDVTPYRHGIWCTSEGYPDAFTNEIVMRCWSEDGETIWFMLDTHNFKNARPDEMIDVVEIMPRQSVDLLAELDETDARRMQNDRRVDR